MTRFGQLPKNSILFAAGYQRRCFPVDPVQRTVSSAAVQGMDIFLYLVFFFLAGLGGEA